MLSWLLNLFKRKQNTQAPAQQNVQEKSVAQLKTESAIQTALSISAKFEGEDGFSNVVGDFDGQCLTCGALGWTWKFGQQQQMILDCEKQYPGIVQKYMPNQGSQYLFLCSKPIFGSSPEVSKWSQGALVSEPYRAELRALWGCQEMIRVQIDHARPIANKAMAEAFDWAHAHNPDSQPQLSLQEFCFFFDLVVNNGSLLGLTYSDVELRIRQSGVGAVKEEVLAWCLNQANKDCRKNGEYWQSLPLPSTEEFELWVLGWLRSLKARPEWAASVMNRRGILALGSGYIDGVKYDLFGAHPEILTETVVYAQ